MKNIVYQVARLVVLETCTADYSEEDLHRWTVQVLEFSKNA